MKVPGPDYPISISANPNQVTVTFNGETIAESKRALQMQETHLPPVNYIPQADVAMDRLEKTEHSSYCPYKGEASYWTIRVGDKVVENAVWTYEQPYDAVADIKDYVAFYANKVDSISA